MEQDQILRAEKALCFYSGLVRNLHNFHPWVYEATSMIPIGYLIHPVERQRKKAWTEVRTTWKYSNQVIPMYLQAAAIPLKQTLFHGGLFVTTMEQIQHDLQSFGVMDDLRQHQSHPLSLLRYGGAKLMALKDIMGIEIMPNSSIGDTANIMVTLADSFKHYYTSNDWFGVGSPAWTKSQK